MRDMTKPMPMGMARPPKMVKNAETAYEKSRTTAFKQGGSASSRADGCAKRGKTRGKMV